MDASVTHRWGRQHRTTTYLLFRVGGMLGVALVAALVPAVGENRLWVAGIIALLGAPLAIFLNLRFPVTDNGWVEPFLDLLLVVGLVHLKTQTM